MSGLVHERGQRCLLTLGADDVVTARGVRLASVAPSLDAIAVDVDPARLLFARERFDSDAAQFLLQLSQRLAGGALPLLAHVGTDHGGDAAAADASRVEECLSSSIEAAGTA